MGRRILRIVLLHFDYFVQHVNYVYMYINCNSCLGELYNVLSRNNPHVWGHVRED